VRHVAVQAGTNVILDDDDESLYKHNLAYGRTYMYTTREIYLEVKKMGPSRGYTDLHVGKLLQALYELACLTRQERHVFALCEINLHFVCNCRVLRPHTKDMFFSSERSTCMLWKQHSFIWARESERCDLETLMHVRSDEDQR
jgi:hypothetical protein